MKYNINKLLAEIEMLPEWGEQISLQGIPGNTDHFQSCGKFMEISRPETDYTEPLFPELTYLNFVIADLGLARARLMRLEPRFCYTWHADPSPRVHVPLITNPGALFILENEAFHMPADGSFYVVDTRKNHTALNGGKEDRIHLVGAKL